MGVTGSHKEETRSPAFFSPEIQFAKHFMICNFPKIVTEFKENYTGSRGRVWEHDAGEKFQLTSTRAE